MDAVDRTESTSLPGTRVSRVSSSLRSWLRTGVLDPTLGSPSDFAAYDAHAHANDRQRLYRFALLMTALNVFFWLTDAWVFRGLPGAAPRLAAGRAALVFVALAMVVTLRLRMPLYAVRVVAGTAVCFVTGLTLGSLGGLGTPWFHFLHTFVLLPTLGVYRPLRRLLYVVLLGAGCLLGFIGPRPAYLHDPFAPTSLAHFGYMVVLSFAVGCYADAHRVRTFLAQQRLAAEREALKARVAEATATLRRLVGKLDGAVDTERARVARELHDELGQSLTAMRLVLKTARDRFERNPAAIGANLEQMTTLLADITVEMRRIVGDMRPRVLDDGGLEPALAWLASQTSERGVRCRVHHLTDVPLLPSPVATAAFRCTQEALTNALKHARASEIMVTVRVDDPGVEVVVSDDGCGIGTKATGDTSLGLVGMAERAHALGGVAEVGPGAPRGTRVRIWLPRLAERVS